MTSRERVVGAKEEEVVDGWRGKGGGGGCLLCLVDGFGLGVQMVILHSLFSILISQLHCSLALT